jgi:hypothetical protein
MNNLPSGIKYCCRIHFRFMTIFGLFGFEDRYFFLDYTFIPFKSFVLAVNKSFSLSLTAG